MVLNDVQRKYILNKLSSLKQSKFRRSFHLRKYMISYIDKVGLEKIENHAREFIKDRIACSNPKNDGRQTPMKGHPVFIAQHACGCCCRSCLEKWHSIPKGRELTEKEINYLVCLIMCWISLEYNK